MTQGCQWPIEWSQCFEAFLRSIRAKSAETAKNYRCQLLRFFSRSAGGGPPKAPGAYTRADVEDFLWMPNASHHRNGGQAPSSGTRNMRIAILSSFYKYASEYEVKNEAGKMVPLFTGRLPTAGFHPVQAERKYRALSYEEIQRFFAKIPSDTVIGLRDRAIFACFFWTARRLSEIARLQIGDIQPATFMENGIARPGFTYRFFGKGHRNQEDRAELPMPAKLAIDAYLNASGRLPLEDDDPVFVAAGSPDGGGLPRDPYKHLSTSAISWAVKRYARLAGLDVKKITVHSFRHSAAQQRYAAGEDIRSIQRLLRHASIGTTDIYLSILSGTNDPGVQLLMAKFGQLV